jgi:ATP-binding cassette subfamily B multidrug efflux pump
MIYRRLRESVAVVLQKNTLSQRHDRFEFALGQSDATDDEIRKACQIAQADDFIESFPDKYNTKLDEGGTNVSGGQKQRILHRPGPLEEPEDSDSR